jgi:general secretion pathway protein H
MTLMEMMIVTMIAALVMTGLALGMGAITRQRLKSSALKVASAVRMAYSRAATSGKTVRIVFDLDSQVFYAEEAEAGRVLLDRDDDGSSEEEAEGEEGEDSSTANRPGILGGAPGGDPLASLMGVDREQFLGAAKGVADSNMGSGLDIELASKVGSAGSLAAGDIDTPRYRRPRFGAVSGRLGQRNKLEQGVVFSSIYTSHRDHPAQEGRAYLYFFSGGMTELSVIQLLDTGGYVNSVEVHPLTGRCTIHNAPFEPPYREEELNEAAEML